MYTPAGLEDKEDCLKTFAPLVKRPAHHDHKRSQLKQAGQSPTLQPLTDQNRHRAGVP